MINSGHYTRFQNRIWRRRLWRYGLLGAGLAFVFWVIHLDAVVREKFEGRRWAVPVHVYARPLELYVGLRLEPGRLLEELKTLGYRRQALAQRPGTYQYTAGVFIIVSRPFRFWDSKQASLRFRLTIRRGEVSVLQQVAGSVDLPLLRLEPVMVGSIYPGHHEDRIPVKITDVSAYLVSALIAIEDHDFFAHHGVALRGLARAFFVNLRAGKAVQGGSTLTQQLVKNFYLSAERTLRRKLVELIMALLLEFHYDKEEILEAYINEIYLGQQGPRAIHGFGLASQFYFGRPLRELEMPQLAMLVGMIKGPSFFNPRRHPERATDRRNLTLREMFTQGFIGEQEHRLAQQAPLGVTEKPLNQGSGHSAYLDLVHRQLRRDYLDEDLRSEGLQVFTTLDLGVQEAAERAVESVLKYLDPSQGEDSGQLQAAVVVTNVGDGEVLAVVGGRDADYAGFNRALDAQRQVGSLIKPAIFLTALAQPGRYTLATLLNDDPLIWKSAGAPDWSPQNYDRKFHGQVALYQVLARSYNVASARLGLELGLESVLKTLGKLGIERHLKPYASTLLGAVTLTPLEVTRMYHTLASGGFRFPLRTVRAVLTEDGVPLKRYELKLQQRFQPEPVYLLNTALQRVISQGTGRGLMTMMPAALNIAGKTGTTNDYRDSWFAGFTGNRLAVVWLGRDDNQPVGLTGASGALRVWGNMMRRLSLIPLKLGQPGQVINVAIDLESGLKAGAGCSQAIELPFIKGSAPEQMAPCAAGKKPVWFKRIFGK
ncbi:MAG TPA: penicillin-binding protein 1B [Acidiferrobacteraceae bacterium]|nr:penicillin-binding protein 1B [Acidiferrobacteraceae bacterium]